LDISKDENVKYYFFPLMLAGLFCFKAGADADIHFHGRLIERIPCVVNNGNMIEVDFGPEVMTTRIEDTDGNLYNQDFSITLGCPTNDVRLKISGGAAGFDPELLAGNQSGLGFRFLNASNTLPVNTWVDISSANAGSYTFRVRPVRQDGVTLEGGDFTTFASLMVDYL